MNITGNKNFKDFTSKHKRFYASLYQGFGKEDCDVVESDTYTLDELVEYVEQFSSWGCEYIDVNHNGITIVYDVSGGDWDEITQRYVDVTSALDGVKDMVTTYTNQIARLRKELDVLQGQYEEELKLADLLNND